MCLNLLTRGTIISEYKLLKAPYLQDADFMDGTDVVWKLHEFFKYFETTFLKSDVWAVHEWCLAGLRIRTNSDMESKYK